ncbi:prepilin-type N-terminal cleavage/methylation domain-containing protein [Alkalicoccobacillus gibsonii]|uniref:prepilin-type N-terminal cleavage/methylation domain-containing protein n=1 Tax=Alkalicoccobacillus gibsonii TaxID=79881 RepID=UPI001933EB25|nr:prepilin-type N-terminal cleavage/methylation domain-containing protein [Alkalicoccobacillus gibsonii]MBM0067215.1 prepilin-type N-terminal cleavage/methylation domain-containing protein [Alkalicoccobacillus gibsonii]
MGIKDRLKNEKGLTLIEVLASVAILLIVLGIGMAALMQSSVLTSKVQGESQDRQDMQVGLLELTKAVQSATDIKKGADNNNFEIVDADNRTSKYQLANGLLNSDSNDGQTQIEGIQKMTIQEGKGITLEIEDLEEPVVLATRGTEIKTELNAPTEDLYYDVICLPGQPFTYDSYPQIGEAEKAGNLSCNTSTGVLTFKNQKSVDLTGGNLRIYTITINFEYRATLTLNNGNLSLPKTKNLNVLNHGELIIKNGSLNIKENINIGNSSSLKVAHNLTDFKSLDVTSSNNSTINVGRNLSGGEAKLKNDNILNVNGNIELENNLEILSTNNILSTEGDVLIKGNALLFQKIKMEVLGDLIVDGNISFSYSGGTTIDIKKDFIIKGNADFGQSYKHNVAGLFYVGKDLNVQKDTVISSNGDIVVKGNIKNGQSTKLTSKSSIYVKGTIQTDRNDTIIASKNFYVENNIHINSAVKIDIHENSFIQGSIYFPESKWNIEGGYFKTNQTLTYTGNLNGSRIDGHNNDRNILLATDSNIVSKITFPSFPSY